MGSSQSSRVDWPSTLAEVVLILLGLLLAFAADRTWEGRQQAQITESYLVRLLSDFEASATELEAAITRQEEILAASRGTLALIASGDEDAIQTELPDLLPKVFDGWMTQLITSTLDEMTATGQLELLNPSLREELARFEALRRSSYQATEAAEVEQWVHRSQPYLNNNVSPDLYLDEATRNNMGVPDSPFPSDATLVAKDPELWSVITHRIIYTSLRLFALQSLHEINRSVIDRLEGEIQLLGGI